MFDIRVTHEHPSRISSIGVIGQGGDLPCFFGPLFTLETGSSIAGFGCPSRDGEVAALSERRARLVAVVVAAVCCRIFVAKAAGSAAGLALLEELAHALSG
jgi:hypothetical protein